MLDSLPVELLIKVIICIPPHEHVLDLRRVNRRFNEVFVENHQNIIRDAEEYWVPDASRAVSYPPYQYYQDSVPSSIPSWVPSFQKLQHLELHTEGVDALMNLLRRVAYNDFGAPEVRRVSRDFVINERWLQLGLHLWHSLLQKWSDNRAAGPSSGPPRHSPSTVEWLTFISALSPFDCIVMRHASIAYVMVLVANSYNMNLSPWQDGDHESLWKPYTLSTLLTSTEQALVSWNHLLHLSLLTGSNDAMYKSYTEERLTCLVVGAYEANNGIIPNQNHDNLEMESSFHWYLSLLTARVRDVYCDWEVIDDDQRRQIMRGLKVAEDEEDIAREKIKFYILNDPTTWEWYEYNKWIWAY